MAESSPRIHNMLRSRKVCLNDLNPHLLCALCGGYFVDATTIIECLHSFCKTCIVRYLETSKYCPVCDVQVHKTRPLQNIRSDQTLQDIVYKLVPGLFQREMQVRRDFYAQNSEASPVSREDAGEATDNYYFYSADDQISLSLQYAPSSDQNGEPPRRYLRCPAAVTVSHLQKLLRAKHSLSQEHKVDLCYEIAGTPLSDSFSLMDIAYIHHWKRNTPLHLYYQIYERPCKRRKLEGEPPAMDTSVTVPTKEEAQNTPQVEEKSPASKASVDGTASSPTKALSIIIPPCVIAPVSAASSEEGSEDKEVQLQISETGVMKVLNLLSPTLAAKETIISSGKVDSPLTPPKVEQVNEKQVSESLTEITKSDINGNKKESERLVDTKLVTPMLEPEKKTAAKPKVSNLAPTITRPEEIKKPLEISPIPTKEIKTNIASSSIPVAPKHSPMAAPTLEERHEKPVKHAPKETKEIKKDYPTSVAKSPNPIVKKTASPVGYKTLKSPPKHWNPSVSLSNYLVGHSALSKANPSIPKSSAKADTKITNPSKSSNVPVPNKPSRFFKERDRPRFLGNPSDKVTPMFPKPPVESPSPSVTPPSSSSSFVKIDPKTLSPIVSKPPVTSQNNNHLSCNAVTSSTTTVTTTLANPHPLSKMHKSSLLPPQIPPVTPQLLHHPPNPLMYNYPNLHSPPLMKSPLIPPGPPHVFNPFATISQAMFFGGQHPNYPPPPSPIPPPPSLPAVQRIPANVQAQKSPPISQPPPPKLSLPSSTITNPTKSDNSKTNGGFPEKVSKKEEKISEKTLEVVKQKTSEVDKPQPPRSVSKTTDSSLQSPICRTTTGDDKNKMNGPAKPNSQDDKTCNKDEPKAKTGDLVEGSESSDKYKDSSSCPSSAKSESTKPVPPVSPATK